MDKDAIGSPCRKPSFVTRENRLILFVSGDANVASLACQNRAEMQGIHPVGRNKLLPKPPLLLRWVKLADFTCWPRSMAPLLGNHEIANYRTTRR